jgi:hypothetical protein
MNPFLNIYMSSCCFDLEQLMDSGADDSTLLMQTAKLQVQPARYFSTGF